MLTSTKNQPRASANGNDIVAALTSPAKQLSFENLLITSLFCAVVFYGAYRVLEASVHDKSSVTEQEARVTKQMPRLRSLRRDLPLFAPAFEAFIIDHFPSRYDMTSLRNLLLLKVFNSSGHADVGVGTNGWLFYFPANVLQAQVNRPSFSRLNLALWTRAIAARQKFLADHGIKYLFMVVPEKATIYPEYFAPGLKIEGGKSRLDELQDALRDRNALQQVDFIDLKKALTEHKTDNYLLYKKYDAHWNFYGALICAKLIGSHLQSFYPEAQFFERKDLPISMEKSVMGDLTSALALSLQMPESVPVVDLGKTSTVGVRKDAVLPFKEQYLEGLYNFTQKNDALPKVFMIHDSYVRYYMMPMIAELCRDVQFHWTQEFSTEKILEQKPDVFIEEMAERHLVDTDPPNVPEMVKVTHKTSFVDATIGDGAGHPAIASYNDQIELVDAAIKKSVDGYSAKLLWRADENMMLDKSLEIHILDKSGATIGKKHYRQDVLSRAVKTGDAWLDTVDLGVKKLPDGAKLGFLVLPTKGGLLPAQAKTSDWSATRVLIDASNLIQNWIQFEQNYH